MMKKMPKKSLDLNNIEIVYEGILKKSPPLKSRSLFNMIAKFSCATDNERTSSIFFQKRWRKRYFVLFKNINRFNEIHFLYFKSKPSPDSRSLGSINMENFGSLSVDVGKKLGKTNVFSIQTVDEKGNDRIYYLRADSYELMNIWVENIVNSLDLNKNNKVPYRSPTVQSPMIHSLKTTPRSSQIRPMTPGNHQAPRRSSKGAVDVLRMSGSSQPNENITAYYNMDKILSSNMPETLEDSFFADEDDIYKFPCEPTQQHSYFNLNDDFQTPIPKSSSNVGQMFFGNDINSADSNTNQKQTSINTTGEYRNLKAHNSFFCEKHNDISQYHSDNFIHSKGEDFCNEFDFELPSRIRQDDSSSTSSCYSSANTNSSTKESGLNNESISFKDLKSICPPQVPKRLNICDNSNVPTPRKQSSDAALPIKLQKPMKSDNFDSPINGPTDETSMLLNYLDAKSLLLENKSQNISNPAGINAFSNLSDPCWSSLNISPTISLEPKNVNDTNLVGNDLLTNHNLDMIRDSVSSNLSTICPIVKDAPLVEYSEIDDARTEGLHKLNERILKNE